MEKKINNHQSKKDYTKFFEREIIQNPFSKDELKKIQTDDWDKFKTVLILGENNERSNRNKK